MSHERACFGPKYRHRLTPVSGPNSSVPETMLQISPTTFRSILILQTKFIGDIVLASTLAKNLQLQYPGVRIVFLCEARFAGFLTGHGIASEVVPFSRAKMRGSVIQRGREFFRTLRELRRHRFDMTIDITCSKTSRVISEL